MNIIEQLSAEIRWASRDSDNHTRRLKTSKAPPRYASAFLQRRLPMPSSVLRSSALAAAETKEQTPDHVPINPPAQSTKLLIALRFSNRRYIQQSTNSITPPSRLRWVNICNRCLQHSHRRSTLFKWIRRVIMLKSMAVILQS